MKARDYFSAVGSHGAKWYPEDIVGYPFNTKGEYFFVDADMAAGSHGGKSWDDAFPTINEAMAVAGDDDVVYVGQGQYKEDATINITQENLKLIAANTGPNHALIRTEIRQHGNVDTPCITLNAHGVEIAGFRMTPYSGDDEGIGILMATDQNVYGAYIHDNYFYAVETGYMAQAIHLGDDTLTYATDSTCIFNNFFYAGGTGTGGAGGVALGIIQSWNTCRLDIRGNFFEQYTNHATNYAINLQEQSPAVNGTRATIIDNQFFAAELTVELSAAVAIKNPVSVGGDCFIDGNTFVNYAAADTMIASRTAECLGTNYANGTIIAVAG